MTQGGTIGLQARLECGVAGQRDAVDLDGLVGDPAFVVGGLSQKDVEFVVLDVDILQRE